MAAADPSNTYFPIFDPWYTPYELNDGTDKRTGNDRFSKRRQREWLKRSKNFPGLSRPEWQARKFIGRGTYGLCGVWDRKSSRDPQGPQHIVVKQVGPNPAHVAGLQCESHFLHLLASTGTDHVVEQYRGCHRGQGTGTDYMIDPIPFRESFTNPGAYGYNKHNEVARIYLEYLPNGDVGNLGNKIHAQTPSVIPEEHLWRMLHCFAKAYAVLEYGTEDLNFLRPAVNVKQQLRHNSPLPTAQAADADVDADEGSDPSQWRPICHFDLKPENVLVGDRQTTEHRRLEVLKLADFGMSRFAPLNANARRTQGWIRGTQWRATRGYMSPEQFHENHSNRDIYSATNIWGLGAVIRYLITRETSNATQSFMHVVDPFALNPAPIRIHGSPSKLLDPTFCPYSTRFINALCKCLAFDPYDRFKPSDLLSLTTETLAAYDSIPNRQDADIHSLRRENHAAFNILPPIPGVNRAAFQMPAVKRSLPVNPAPGTDYPDYRPASTGSGTPILPPVIPDPVKDASNIFIPKSIAKAIYPYIPLDNSP